MIKKILDDLKIDLYEILKSLGVNEDVEIFFEVPQDTNFGDFSTNIAMRLAKTLRKSPVMIAKDIISRIDVAKNHIIKVDVAGAGFINFFFDRKFLSEVIFEVLKEKENFGNIKISDEKVNIEFVSANPTGYLHIAHGRGASYGDSLSRILKKSGYNVTKEHYVNDGGNQINNLGFSIQQRYFELFGRDAKMEDGYYHGKEIIEIAKMIKEEVGDKYLDNDGYEYFRQRGMDYLLQGLKDDLKDFNVEFDVWFSEKSLYDNGEVEKTLNQLIKDNHTYELDGAIWLKTTDYNDEKDRVLVKSDKSLTYLTPDIAYHKNKLSRGYDQLIDVLGADHHGYINRLKAAIACVGGNPDKVHIEILQMVRVIQDGVEVKMSKRSGKSITLRDIMDEVGSDAIRYMYSAKALSTPMDLDLDLALRQTNENPVYYVQYAYARIASLFRMLKEKNIEFKEVSSFTNINLEKCDKIIMTLLQYPLVIEEAALKRLPHKIAQYAYSLASALHSYYNDEKIITENSLETNEKLTMMKAVQIVLKDSLNLLGVNVKEKM
ncbi:MAG: arginine--tRNA ligase [Bacilli bacterium]